MYNEKSITVNLILLESDVKVKNWTIMYIFR